MSIFLFSELLFLSGIGQVFQGQTFQNDLRIVSPFRRRWLANQVQRQNKAQLSQLTVVNPLRDIRNDGSDFVMGSIPQPASSSSIQK